VNKRSHQAKDEIEKKPAPQDIAPEPTSGKGDEGKKERKPASRLDMLFREAEVIAKNLKESGTRR
jgi:hypothetical protein